MSQFIITINDENKAEEANFSLTNEQKRILDERRLMVKKSDFIDWDIAKQNLRFNR